MRHRQHALRLSLLSLLFLIAASGSATLAARFSADWVRFAAALIPLAVLVPLANAVYVQHGILWLLAVGLVGAAILVWMWGLAA
jgi:hypothetical protein